MDLVFYVEWYNGVVFINVDDECIVVLMYGIWFDGECCGIVLYVVFVVFGYCLVIVLWFG